MQDIDNGSFSNREEDIQPKELLSEGIFKILFLIALAAFIMGFTIIISTIVALIPQGSFLLTHGLVIGLLLFISGIFLLIGLIILQKDSKKARNNVSSEIDRNYPNI